jgi:hypothetical protein
MNCNWSVDTTELEKDSDTYNIWRLEQWVNWGIGTEKVRKSDLIKYWDRLDIDAWKRKAISLALFN